MRIGVPKEIKSQEYRVGLTPESVSELGAIIKVTAAEIFEACDMIVKVKEPQAAERAMLRPGQILYTYLHLAPDPEQTKELIDSGAVCIAYETVGGPPCDAGWGNSSAKAWRRTRHAFRRSAGR